MYEDAVRGQSYAMVEMVRKAAEHVPAWGSSQGRTSWLLYVDVGKFRRIYPGYMWFTLATTNKIANMSRQGMTPAQISEAQRMAEEWKRLSPNTLKSSIS